MLNTQHGFTVFVVVKGPDRKAAESTLYEKMAAWFLADVRDKWIPGYGSPNGSLLYYTVEEERR